MLILRHMKHPLVKRVEFIPPTLRGAFLWFLDHSVAKSDRSKMRARVVATWWHCPCAHASTPSPSPSLSPHPYLQLCDIPASASAPLFFCWCVTSVSKSTKPFHSHVTSAISPVCSSACNARLLPCESCHVLLDASSALIDSLLCCRRCGSLSVFDASLRAVLGIAPVSRTLLVGVWKAPVLSLALAPTARQATGRPGDLTWSLPYLLSRFRNAYRS